MAGSGWNELALKVTFQRGLNEMVLTEMACHDESLTLDSLIDLAIRLDNLLHKHPAPRLPAPSIANEVAEEPMQLSRTHMNVEEWERRKHLALRIF